MPNYVKTGPFSNGGSPGLSASFFNAVENVFRQPSGGTETGKYRLLFNASGVGFWGSLYMPTISRGTAPVSVTIDTADDTATAISSGPNAVNSTSNGFQITAQASGANGNCHCGGNYTVTY